MYEYYVLPFFLDLGTDSCFSFMFYRFKSFGFSYFYFLCLAWSAVSYILECIHI